MRLLSAPLTSSLLPITLVTWLLAGCNQLPSSGKPLVWQADLGDGQYQNPVIHADYSDPDAIRVGKTYYMTSSSFNSSPALPLLESKIRKMVRSLWLGEVSHFGGLWLHASEQLQATEAMTELRQLILQLTQDPAGPGSEPAGEEPFSSVLGNLAPSGEATSSAPFNGDEPRR